MWNRASKAGAPTSPDAADEAHLLRRTAGGDIHAFELLYRRYFPRLMRFLDRMVHRPSLSEEIVNDTMLTVWNAAGRYDGSCKPSTWIFAIAWRKAMKAVRSLDEPVEHDFETTPDDSRREPAQAMQRQELHEQLEQALKSLPFAQRAVVCLTYFHGLGYAEIADIMECPANTVKTRMFHARHKLESLLADLTEVK
jgi:RNA polymerase sigma-70 factor (ECF subfamily)